MVAMHSPACRVFELDGRHQQPRKLTSMDNQPSFFRGNETEWAGSRERNLASGRGGAFFLTSLFIELIDEVVGMTEDHAHIKR